MERTRQERSNGTAEIDVDRYVSYEESEATVICDRRTPSAWIRSTVTRQLER